MSCDHNCNIDHNHDQGYSLYSYIDTARVRCLNLTSACTVLKPWDLRFDPEYIESDADEQLIIFVPFTGSVKLTSIAVLGPPDAHAPSHFKVFINRDIDFDSTDHVQEWQMVQHTHGWLPEYHTRVAKFGNVRSISLFFTANHGAPTTRISYIGFKGDFSPLNKDPIITNYEIAANPSDHKIKEKININQVL